MSKLEELSEAFKDKLELISLTENKNDFSKFQTKRSPLSFRQLEVGPGLAASANSAREKTT